MDRLEDPRADQEGAQERERERAADQGHVPHLQRPPPLLDHDRVQEGRARQPRHQRGVLDRVPPPVAAPAELRVRPAGAQQDADPQEQPGDQREAAGGADPARVEAAGDQRADRERERDREEDVARVEHRRVDRHRRVAKQRRQPDALRRHRVKAGERVGAEQHQAGEEDAQPHQHRGRPGGDLAVLVAGREQDRRGGQREHPGPQQQRALLARPHRGQLVEVRRRGRGVVGDHLQRQVGAREGGLDHDHADRQQDGERIHGPSRRVGEPALAPVPASAAITPVAGDQEGEHQARGAERDHWLMITCSGSCLASSRTSTGTS